jgi:putative FmdB family regulatory protein
MPFYDYRCEACGHEFEAMQKMSDAPLTDCPECKAPALKKQLSAAGFRLKGGGWYETDFKSGQKKNIHDTGKSEQGSKAETKKSESGSKSASTGTTSAKSS